MKTSQALVRTTIRTELGPSEAKNQAPVRQSQAVERTESSRRKDKSHVTVRTRQAVERTRLRPLGRRE